ncbi:MAG TPA: hypothetical protein VNJ04_05025 [Gemmatimonadaceae bacterium]|nr:hypothetical protein [Gemmatimonadaceae bacterium]
MSAYDADVTAAVADSLLLPEGFCDVERSVLIAMRAEYDAKRGLIRDRVAHAQRLFNGGGPSLPRGMLASMVDAQRRYTNATAAICAEQARQKDAAKAAHRADPTRIAGDVQYKKEIREQKSNDCTLHVL